ncbi:zinc-dependent peptidase [Sinimarinibacterium sp. CAU 1509]|uniref:M90 family metallopeptidase n=1 Tax=Sinimarinibacterium sp. CAU 1509 TaxID=2562283 RepID=UPI00200B3FF2|nr:M90 family metallopeptidase [Sinimarinibacterium sp. CAU 1509]
MTPVAPEAVAALVVVLAVVIGWMFRSPRPRTVAELPPQWREQLYRQVPHAVMVPAALSRIYEDRVRDFLLQKRFVPCAGLKLSDDMRVAVAGLACLLVLRPGARLFPDVRAVLLYADRFYVKHDEPDEFGLVSDAPVEQLGESWHGDRVVLSWADVEAALHGDAVNVVAHEFAHQLDDENPDVQGAPALHDYSRWSEVMLREYQRLQRHRRPPVLDPYGAESPGEFFGVATEAFFQRGAALRQHHAELYALFHDYYGLDTAQHALWGAHRKMP